MAGTKMSGGTRTYPQGGRGSGPKAPTRPVIKQAGSSTAAKMGSGTKKGNGSPASGPVR